MTPSDLLACADERETIIARLMQTYRLSRTEAADMLEQFGDITDDEPTNGS